MSLLTAYEQMMEKAAAAGPERAGRRQQELVLWQQWKQSNHAPEHLDPLLSSLQPLMTQHVNRYAGNVPVSRPALEGEVTRLTVRALKSYSPTRGAQLSTYVTGQLKGLNRFVTQHQNVSRITEDRSQKIGRYQRANTALTESLGRPPTAEEVADEMKVSVRTVNRLAQEMRADLLGSGSEHDPFLDEEPRSREILRLMYPYAFSLDEQKVFEYLLGLNGRTKELKTGKIAKTLGWSDSKVRQTRAAIANKVKPSLNGSLAKRRAD